MPEIEGTIMENIFEMRMHLDTGMREFVHIETGIVVTEMPEKHTFKELRAWIRDIRENYADTWDKVYYNLGKAVAQK